MKKSFLILAISLIINGLVLAKIQEPAPKTAEVKIKTSAICGQCKQRIEHDLAFEKGVVSSNLDVKTKIVTVIYKPKKTDAEKIKTAISKIGYAADDIKADEKAYNKLPECCQKEVEGDADKH
jgi:periplasmic mercuric ion binding protein